nr:hypothetical protein [Tanacetum cinerariifolium]
MQKNLALITKYFKRIYKPTNNNLRTSSNSRNKNVDTTLWYKNYNQSGQFGNQRTMNVAGAKENLGSPVVQQSGIHCFNYTEFGHFAKECRKPKRVKDSVYHKEKMLLCKQAEKGVPLLAEQYDWLADTYEEIDEQELEAHYSYMVKIQEQSESISNTCIVETDDSNVIPDSPDMCEDDIQNDQNDVESDDEQTSKTLGESNSVQDSCLVTLQNKQTEFEMYKAFNDCTVDYDKLERKLNETLGQLPQKDIEIKEGVNHKTNVSRPHHRSNQMKDKVVQTIVKTSNVNAVCATCGKCLVDSDHFSCVTKMLNDMNARTKKPNVVPISTRKPKGHANKSVATPHKKKVASKSTT